ncbi:MAG: hypothetical protein RLZZ488_779 [Pseudomonadota bacterium]|jgi:hypothetical protein
MKFHRSPLGGLPSAFEQRRLKPHSRSRIPVKHSPDQHLWGYIFLSNLDSDSLFAARTLAQALSEHVLRPHLTLLLVSLQHTLRYFGSWDTLARVYHAQVQHLTPAARPRLLLTHHLFAGLHFGATHPQLEFAIANENNLQFRQHLSQLNWPQWKEACLLFASLLQLKSSEQSELIRSVRQFADAALSMRFTSPLHFPDDLSHDDISRRFGPWAVIFWEMWRRPEVSLGTVFKDLPQDLCAQDFLTSNFDTPEFSAEPSYPLAQLMPMLEACLRKLLFRLGEFSSLEQHFGIRDFRVTLELENNLKVQHTCLLNEPIVEFNKTTALILQNVAAKLPNKGQEFQHPSEPSFYFKAFQIYRLTIEPLRLTPCLIATDNNLHQQRAPVRFEKVIQTLELKQAGEAYQVPLQASFSTDAKPPKDDADLLSSAEELNLLANRRSASAAPVSLFRYAVQERPLHLVKEHISFCLKDVFPRTENSAHHLEYLETLGEEDLYALHHPPAPALLIGCRSGALAHEAAFVLKGVFEPAGAPLQERFF